MQFSHPSATRRGKLTLALLAAIVFLDFIEQDASRPLVSCERLGHEQGVHVLAYLAE
jgi:hypothetical protein